MEIIFSKEKIEIKDKTMNNLDKFVFDFISLLHKHKIKYVIVSGYVTILFGRNRTSEDVDIIVEHFNADQFKALWDDIQKKFYCINTSDRNEAYRDYLLEGVSLRFSKKNSFIPNIEFKFPKLDIDAWTVENRKKVSLNTYELFISPLELQIPFKLYLGSQKDIEDARHLYKVVQDHLDTKMLNNFNQKFKTYELFNTYIT